MDETLLGISQGLIIMLLTILPILALILIMSLDIKPFISKYVVIFLLLFLPLILILIGVVVGVDNFNVSILELTAGWYYIISVIWFAEGIIFYSAIE